MDWNNALRDSLIWLAQAYVITLMVTLPIIWVLARRTVWGRQFWRLSGAYFSPRNGLRPLLMLALILLLTLGGVRLGVLFSMWYNRMYTSLQQLDAPGFWAAMWLFALLAAIHVARALTDFYLQQAFIIRWREWLNTHLLSQWMSSQAYYRSQYLSDPVDNPDQRVQQDITLFAQTSLSLSMGVINAVVSIMAYTLILWNLSGPMTVGGVTVPHAMVFVLYVYVLLATVIAIYIGRPLIQLNFLNERYTADYRYALVRLREYAESIAFYAGEAIETHVLLSRFARVISNAWAIVYRSLKFLGFNFVVTQTAVVFPFILQAQRFFTQQITLGDLMQTSQAFGQLQDNLSFFRNAYDDFASYRATLVRLDGFQHAIDEAGAMPMPQHDVRDHTLALDQVTLRTPAGHWLARDVSVSVEPGQPLLIRGPSGSGKTTLLRALAGLWPYSSGRFVQPPTNQTLFLSQKPYLPLGSLREALHYPHAVPASPEADERARDILREVQLGHLAERLDDTADWGRILSLGEQQRLAFGRLLLAEPQAAFLDEATSAMDEGLEDAMYRLVRARLPDMLLVSVGHRSSLFHHHTTQLSLKGDGEGGWSLDNMPTT